MASSKGAAGARRSAIAERARLQAEWAALKSSDSPDVLRGVLALVDVGEGTKAIALRAALAALGATVAPEWSPLVTHVVWTSEGSRSVRAAARSLAARLVSPLWVEACASAARRLPERAFPTGARASDLPSPRALRQMLRIAEKENLTLLTLSDTINTKTQEKDKKEEKKKEKEKPVVKQTLRISSENETTTDRSTDSSDQSKDRSIPRSHVNTNPRRALPASIGTPDVIPEKKSKRKLFTYKEAEVAGSESDSSDDAGVKVSVPKPSLPSQKTKTKPRVKMATTTKTLTHQDRKDLARAERMARRLAATPKKTCSQGAVNKDRIVLTGMSRSERISVIEAIRQLNGRLQRRVNRKTTHVIMGSCRDDERNTPLEDITGIQPLNDVSCIERDGNCTKATCGSSRKFPVLSGTSREPRDKARTLQALEGAARGCRVLSCNWALESAKEGRWLHPDKYEIPHLKKLSQKARIERSALGRQRREYAYNVFNGARVDLADSAEQRDAAGALLALCGGREGAGPGGVRVGRGAGDVATKWVFDSVAAARPRSLRRYVVAAPIPGQAAGGDDDVFITVENIAV